MEEVGVRPWVHSALYHPALGTPSTPAPPPLARREVTLSLFLIVIIKGSHPAKSGSAFEQHLSCILKISRGDILRFCSTVPPAL